MKQLLTIMFFFSCISAYTQNCAVDFPGTGTINYSLVCGGSAVDQLDLGAVISMDDGDVFIFDSPATINIFNKLDIYASGSGTVVIPRGVTVNLINAPLHLHDNGGCDPPNPCNFNIIVEGVLNVGKELNNHLTTLTWSGSGSVNLNDRLENKNDGCMNCGETCPAFPNKNGCRNGNCSTNFCANNGNYGNAVALEMAQAGPDQNVCEGNDVTLAADVSGGTGTWSPVTGVSDVTDPNAIVSGLPEGSHSYTWTTATGTDTMVITVVALPSKPTITTYPSPATVCSGAVVDLTSSPAPNGGTYSWYIDGVFSPGYTTQQITVSGLAASGDYTVGVTDGALPYCVSVRSDPTTVRIVAQPAQPEIMTSGSLICEGSTVTLSTPEIPDGSYVWRKDGLPAGLTRVIILDKVSQSGDYTVEVVNSTRCNSMQSEKETVTIQPAPSPARIMGDNSQLLCDVLSTDISAASPDVGIGRWSIDGIGTIADATRVSTTVSKLEPGTETALTWTVTNGICEPKTDVLELTVRSSPSKANAGKDQKLCDQVSTALEANTPTEGIGEWSVVRGMANLADPLKSNTDISALDPGTDVELVWTVFNECGSNVDKMLIKNEKKPDIADAGMDQVWCDVQSIQLNAGGEGGSWSVKGPVVIDNSSDASTMVSNLDYGTTTFTWAIPGQICTGNSDDVSITVYEKPDKAIAGDDILLCDAKNSTKLKAKDPKVGQGQWSVIGNSGAIIKDIDKAKTEISELPIGQTTLRWTVSNGTCEDSIDEMVVTVYPRPVVAYDRVTICEGESVQLDASGGASYLWSPAEGLSATTISNPIASPTSTAIYTVNISNEACGSSDFSVEVIVNPVPRLITSTDTSIFRGSSVALFASGATSYSWTPAESLDRSDISNPVATPLENTTYTVTGTNDFNCSSESEINIRIDQEFQVFVPELFSPNGDQVNDVLMVNALGIKNLIFKIFDRKGKELFSTVDPKMGWDGQFNGKEQLNDTYVYYVYGETINGEPVNKKGSFQLVR